jgi:hypothetical protein
MNLSTYVLYVSHCEWMYLSCYLLLMLAMKSVLSPLWPGLLLWMDLSMIVAMMLLLCDISLPQAMPDARVEQNCL